MDKALAIQKEVQKILGTDEVYLVGGSVRDLVMGNTPKDYDFCTPMLPDEMEERIKAAGRKAYGVGKNFGTMGFKVPVPIESTVITIGKPSTEATKKWTSSDDPVFIHWGYEYVEVTTFRSEVYTSKSRKPEVEFVPNLEEDLARRDFTMNAMVLKPSGIIYDPYGGKLDIHAKRIKTVGTPKERIMEDPLRMLRAARFAARYNFDIDPNFIGKARQLADRIFDVSVERWVQELDKMITSDYYMQGFDAMDKMKLIERILPEPIQFSFIDNSTADLAWKTLLRSCDVNPKTAKYVASGMCHRLKFSNDRTKIILDK